VPLTANVGQGNPKRQDIQALRGFAVLAVVLYHLEFPLIHGGFLGVDIFFVISGFVITETILRSTGTLKQRLAHFYYRRARRILPAATFVAVLTFLAAVLFLPRPYFGKYVFDTISSLFMFSNAGFAYQNLDYLNQGLNPSPFLHYWSLAVEEQFYLVWPLVLILIVRNRKRLLLALLPLLFVGAVLTTHFKPGFSYLSPSSRAWEFLAGALVVFLSKEKFGRRSRQALLALASTAILISLIFINNQSATPSFSTALPVLSAALLIYLGFESKFLGGMAKIGDISYSLYLIHWPLIVIANAIFGDLSLVVGIAIFVASIFFARLVSVRIESPFRYGEFKPALKKSVLVSVVLALAVLGVAASTGFLGSGKDRGFVIDAVEPITYNLGCHVYGEIPKVEGCDFGDTSSAKRVLLVGDSHAEQFFPGLNVAAKRAGYRLSSWTKSACPAIALDDRPAKREADCREWERRIISLVNTLKPDILVFTNFTERPDLKESLGMTIEDYKASFDDFVLRIRESAAKIVYIGDSPYPGEDSIACLTREHKTPTKCDVQNSKRPLTTVLEQEAKRLGLTFIDSRSFLCEEIRCRAIVEDKNVYRDDSHISVHIFEIVAKGLAPIFT
jgi:peptidoglycan/LPS O-acetylase OafA/YrhL